MERFCKDNGVRCIRMQDRDSAVCRGALINAMNENFFGWRLSRAYFGILVRENGRTYIKWFIRRVSPKRRFWHPLTLSGSADQRQGGSSHQKMSWPTQAEQRHHPRDSAWYEPGTTWSTNLRLSGTFGRRPKSTRSAHRHW